MRRERTEQEKLVMLNLIDDARLKLVGSFVSYSENKLETARDELRDAIDNALSASRIIAVELGVVSPDLGRRRYKFKRSPKEENGRVTSVADLISPR